MIPACPHGIGHGLTGHVMTVHAVNGGMGIVLSQALLQKRKQDGDEEIMLRLLEHVVEDERLSQAKFAARIGIAKGLANAYFNRCVQKGWIKLGQIPRRRYLYYLTPSGFAEKARLTAQFLTYSYQFYREARADIKSALREAAQNGTNRIGVLGTGELAEISAIVSGESAVEIVGFVRQSQAGDRIAGLPVVNHWRELEGANAALLATVEDALETYDAFRREVPGVPIVVPRQLRRLLGAE